MKRTLIVAVAFLAALTTVGAEAQFRKTLSDRLTRVMPVDPAGSLWIENANGSVTVTGAARTDILVNATVLVRATDDTAANFAKSRTQLVFQAEGLKRSVRTDMPAPTNRWTVTVTYDVQVPRSVQVNVISDVADKVRLTDLKGDVFVRSTTGAVEIMNVDASVNVDSANSDVFVTFTGSPRAASRVQSVNGDIEVRLPKATNFNWIAETLTGEILSGISASTGGFIPRSSGAFYTAVFGRTGGPSIRTKSLSGKIYLLPVEDPRALARSLMPRDTQPQPAAPEELRTIVQRWSPVFVQPPALANASSFVAHNRWPRDFESRTDIGSLFIGQVDGTANVWRKAGEIILGRVLGDCFVDTQGGPVSLGEVGGAVNARTSAGDMFVRAARHGGSLKTGGGSINVIFAGGPITLESGGGDITLRQASNKVRAVTKSGDITLNLDPGIRTQAVDARTTGGNISLNVPPGFAADIDATILSSSDTANLIQSDLPGLSMMRERVGNRTRVHAQGKINGGGKKVQLYVDDGNIRITSIPTPRLIVIGEP